MFVVHRSQINVFYVIMYVLYVLYGYNITYIRSTAKKMGHMLVAARLQVVSKTVMRQIFFFLA